jgi:hypothetical protein
MGEATASASTKVGFRPQEHRSVKLAILFSKKYIDKSISTAKRVFSQILTEQLSKGAAGSGKREKR